MDNYQLTIAVLASTEQSTLKKTIQLLLSSCDTRDIAEIIVFLISSDCPSAAIAKEITEDNSTSVPVRCIVQQLPGLSPIFFEIPPLVHSSHFLVLGADLEMDPLSVPAMIKTSKEHPSAIVCASKFQKGSHRKGYGSFHYLCNRAVNAVVEQLLHIKGTELISSFQIYPLDLYQKMQFSNPKRTYYEYTIRPLSLGAEYIELPTNYKRRVEGASNFNLRRYINLGVTFIRTALSERKRQKLEKNQTESP